MKYFSTKLALLAVLGLFLVLQGGLIKLNAQDTASYDLRFNNLLLGSNTLCVDIQIKSATDKSFTIGSHTFYLSYNKDNLSSPTYNSKNFDDKNLCAFGGTTAPYYAPNMGYDQSSGELNITTIMMIPNFGCPDVTPEWLTAGTICFEMISDSQPTKFYWNKDLTDINAGDDLSVLKKNNLANLDTIPVGAPKDTDNDGLNDNDEITYGTDVSDPDSDDDGLLDGEEVNTYQTKPLNSDTDDDGLTDGAEVKTHNTNPLTDDSDGDELLDGQEINDYKSNPLKADTDDDGINDGEEVQVYGTDPINIDTDADFLTDGEEVFQYLTDPKLADTDFDGLKDGPEVLDLKTDPLKPDTDSDGLVDYIEVVDTKTDPLKPDTDADHLTDGQEVNTIKTDPLNPDTDADQLTDGDEVNGTATNPLSPDTDGDTVADGIEAPNAQNIDTDGDGKIDALDDDDDNDTIPTANEDPNNDKNPINDDTDDDKIANYLDNNDDNDPLLTIDEDTNKDGNFNNDDDDGDGIPDYLDADQVGISGVNITWAKAFPNPTNEWVNITVDMQYAKKIQNVQLINQAGQIVLTSNNYHQLNLHAVANGNYQIIFVGQNQQVLGKLTLTKQ